VCRSCNSGWNNLEKKNKRRKLPTKQSKQGQTIQTSRQVKTCSEEVQRNTLEMNIPGSSIPNGWLAWSEPPTMLNPKGLLPFFKMIS